MRNDDQKRIDKILDEMDLDRLEWDLIQNDINPEGKTPTSPKIRKTHKADAPVQAWLRKQRS